MRNIILLLLIALSFSLILGGCSSDTSVNPAPTLTLTGEYLGIYTYQHGDQVTKIYTRWRFSAKQFQMRCIDTLGINCRYISCDYDGNYSLNEGVTIEVIPSFIPCPDDFIPNGNFDLKRHYNYMTLTQYNEKTDVTKTLKLYKAKN